MVTKLGKICVLAPRILANSRKYLFN
jgi:hypothetical protein